MQTSILAVGVAIGAGRILPSSPLLSYKELALLNEELTTDKPSLAIVYARRRIGKSTLIREAMKDRAHVFYQATRVTSSLYLESFKAEVAHALGADDLLTGLGDWLAVFHYLARAAEQKPGLTIVLDEFPYLVDVDSALPSIIQKFWDSGAARAGNLKLLLCGSMIAQMEELLAERNPLYGRKTLGIGHRAAVVSRSREVRPIHRRGKAAYLRCVWRHAVLPRDTTWV